jgi:hypothetical protein
MELNKTIIRDYEALLPSLLVYAKGRDTILNGKYLCQLLSTAIQNRNYELIYVLFSEKYAHKCVTLDVVLEFLKPTHGQTDFCRSYKFLTHKAVIRHIDNGHMLKLLQKVCTKLCAQQFDEQIFYLIHIIRYLMRHCSIVVQCNDNFFKDMNKVTLLLLNVNNVMEQECERCIFIVRQLQTHYSDQPWYTRDFVYFMTHHGQTLFSDALVSHGLV